MPEERPPHEAHRVSLTAGRPHVTPDEAARLAEERFGARGSATPLDGERDQNFRLDLDDGACAVLKIYGPDERRDVLEMLNEALLHLERQGIEGTPRVLANRDGDTLTSVALSDGGAEPSFVRLLSWIPGRPLADVTPHHPELLRALGRLLGRIDRALADFDHPAAERALPWNPTYGVDVVRDRIGDVADARRRDRLEEGLRRFEATTSPRLRDLPRAVIQCDANDHNVLAITPHAAPPRIAGLTDFGDMVKTWRAAEPAIAAAYAMMGKHDPIATMAALVAGYHAEHPLLEEELTILWDLSWLRLATSVAMAARQGRERPDDPYLRISEDAAWKLLDAMEHVPPRLPRYTLRHHCGLEPCRRTAAVRGWIDRNADGARVLPDDLRETARHVLDLGVDAPGFGDGDTATVTKHVFCAIEDRGALVGVGRYDEVRVCYSNERFQTRGDEAPEMRTVHLGIDLFQPAGTPVSAPFDATIWSVADNAGFLDYGPTVILRHAPPDGPEFFTLYGHLARDSVKDLSPGRSVARDQVFAAIGPFPENGDWPPHLHFQVMVDALDLRGDFPGVAAPSQREVWLALCPDPSPLLGLPSECRAPRAPSVATQRERRRAHLGPSLSVSYRAPLPIVRGRGAQLFDQDGQSHLDCVNNVCHVGHSHPHVVAAAARQMAVLNTNTRYLHEVRLDYVERLLSRFPVPLEVCYLVCSGSEANELALRLARTATGRRDLICLDAAYHGNTGALVDISPYKNQGEGGTGAPDHVHVAPLPDPYRGEHRTGDGDLGALYAAWIERTVERLAAEGRPPAAFIAEPLPGCGGQIVLPAGYLEHAFRAVRAAGGLCIADEVQVGFGRVGTHFWAFETQGVVPDIVTLGKPIGNGHPIGAVITTRAIADAFDNGMEYFNTFGGNPVSCAVGRAVLEVINREQLRENAHVVGAHLLSRLRELMGQYELIGDVRGLGLFVGAELVKNRATREPAATEAAWVVNRLRERRVLVSTDGPDHNVLKIKPPLVFSREDADHLLDQLAAVLREDALRPSEEDRTGG